MPVEFSDLVRAVKAFIAESDYLKANRVEFFRNRGLETLLVSPELGDRSIMIIHDGQIGTAVPPMCTALGMDVVVFTLPKYFDRRNRKDVDLIKGYEIVDLPRLRITKTGWVVEHRGLLDGDLFRQ
jgi:phosphoglycerate dehydrogenase-like enzyme